MSIKLGIIGDPHATAAPVREALAIFHKAGVQRIFCPGDVAGYGNELEATVTLLRNSGCVTVQGNHEIWQGEKPSRGCDATLTFLQALPRVWQETIAGKKLYMVHASPPRSVMNGIRLLDEQGDLLEQEVASWTQRLEGFAADVLIVGHTHQVFSEQLADTLVINPGSSLFNHACAILTLPGIHCEFFPLSNGPLIRTWHWGMMRRG